MKREEMEQSGVSHYTFRVEEALHGQPRRYALQYADVLTHDIELLDL